MRFTGESGPVLTCQRALSFRAALLAALLAGCAPASPACATPMHKDGGVHSSPCDTPPASPARGTSVYKATVVGHVDGDTVAMAVDVWPPGKLGIDRVLVRIRRIDTPEVRRTGCPEEKAAGTRAAGRMKALLPLGTTVWLLNPDQGSFAGRIVSDVMLEDQTTHIKDVMLREGWAVPMWKKRTMDWCKHIQAGKPYPLRSVQPAPR